MIICRFIWKERNLVIFEECIPNFQKVAYSSFFTLGNCKINLKVACCRNISKTYAECGVGGWFDGAVESSGNNCGAGGFIRTSEHRGYKWYFNCEPGTNTKAKLLGAWALLTLASRLSIMEIHIRVDSKITIDWLKGKGRLQVVALECWKDRIKEISKLFQKIIYDHVFKEGNVVADNLSKQALQQEPGKIIYYMCEEGRDGHI
jgi:ribonuclease HI